MADRKLTDVELERYLAGDLSPARVQTLEAAATAADKQRIEELRAQNVAYLEGLDVAAEVRAIGRRMSKLEPPRKLGWWRWLIGAGALASAAAAIVLWVRKPSTPKDDDIITKGDDVSLVVHSESGRLASGDTIQPGDLLRFEVLARKPGFVAIVGVDGSGASTVYFPFGGTTSATFDPTKTLLPGAIKIDATPGDERFYAFYAEQAFAIDTVLPAIRGGTLPSGIRSADVVLKKP